MANQWFKFYGGEYLSDPKMLALSASERSCWLTLLCYASMTGKDGIVTHLTEEMLMAQSGVSPANDEWNETKGVLKKLEKLGMISLSDNEIEVKNWRKRQEMLLTGAERSKRWRDTQRVNRNGEVTKKSVVRNARIEENRIEENRIDNNTDHGFNEFWSAYPRKISKKTAYASWNRIKNLDDALTRKIMESLEEHKKSQQWQKDDGKFIPHPSTWLNQERWNDELKVKNNKNPNSKYDNL